jgi:glycine/D-amino acid oxidase-like deaminating enzyme
MATIKSSYDVIIVGGAAVGSAAAYFLASNPDFGGSVLVVERDWTYARSATALSSSSIRHQFSNPINVQISQFGTAFIRDFKAHVAVDGEAIDLAFKENGYLFLAGDEAGSGVLARNHETQIACGADIVLLSHDELGARFAWLNTDGVALGSHGLSGEGWFDNVGLLHGMRRKARALGVDYIEDEVVAVKHKNGRVGSVVLKSGEAITCGALINAAGTRGPRVARMAGLEIPVEPRRRSLFVFSCQTPLDGKVPLTIDPSGVFFRPEGQFYLAGTEPKSDPEVDVEDFEIMHAEFEDEIWPVLAERVPAFEAIKVVNAWAGHYDYCTLDQNVIVGPHPDLWNFLFANGFSGHGLQQSPAIGRALSELVIHGAYRTLDLSPLGYKRVIQNRPFPETSII